MIIDFINQYESFIVAGIICLVILGIILEACGISVGKIIEEFFGFIFVIGILSTLCMALYKFFIWAWS
jgi:hypothetical protein